MKRKILFSLAVTASLFAGNIIISKGWNLVGAPNNINQTEFTSNNCIKSVWKYDSSKENGPWFLYNRDGLGSSYPKITNGILKGEGFWVLSDCVNDSNISYMDSNATDLQKTLNSIIVTSGSQMAIVGKTGGSGASAASTTISNSTKELGKVLYEKINLSFGVDDDGEGMSGETIIPNTSSTALFKVTFSVNGHEVNASQVTDEDNSGKAYGLDDDSGLPKVGLDLGDFFTKLKTNPSNVSLADYEAIIKEVNTMKARPLFSVVGNDAFQNFFSNFPSDQTSALNADWASLGQEFLDLNLSEDNPPKINFSKINYDLNMSFDGNFTMGDTTLTLPIMVAHGSLDTLLDPNGMNVNFSSDNRIGTISMPITGIDGNISNIEINTTVQGEGDITVGGKYTITIISGDGHTYTGISIFDLNGCKDAVIHDENDNFISGIKMFDDGLWIVDEDENKIKKIDQTTIPTN